jgi:hypothetical protein
LLEQKFSNFATVCSTLSVLHNDAHEWPKCLLLASSHLGSSLRLGCDGSLNRSQQLISSSYLFESLSSNDRFRVAAIGDKCVEHTARCSGRNAIAVHERHKRRK